MEKKQSYHLVCHLVCSRSYWLYGALFLKKFILKIKNYNSCNNSRDTVSYYGVYKTNTECMDWPMLYTGNPYVITPGNVFFMHMILMDSDSSLAMNYFTTNPCIR